MTRITLTEEQSRILEQARDSVVEIRDAKGHIVTSVPPLSAEDQEMIRRSKESRAAGGPLIPSAQVQAHLKRLGEIAAERELSKEEARELVRRMQNGEAV